jgi:hypothetical protein
MAKEESSDSTYTLGAVLKSKNNEKTQITPPVVSSEPVLSDKANETASVDKTASVDEPTEVDNSVPTSDSSDDE